MRLIFITLIGISLIGMLTGTPAFGDDPEARRIMEAVEDRDDGNSRTSDMEMILIDKNNHQRVRKIAVFSKDKGDDTNLIMFFLHPADLKDTALLTYDYKAAEKEDDQWLYLPALHKTKRIAAGDKSGSFMGSDLNYSDFSSWNLDDYDFSLIKEINVKNQKTWLIQATPRSRKTIDETGYSKYLLFVRQDIYFVVRAVYWAKEGGYLKYWDAREVKQIDGIWTATEILVVKKKGEQTIHQTHIRYHNTKFNEDLPYALFSIQSMERGL